MRKKQKEGVTCRVNEHINRLIRVIGEIEYQLSIFNLEQHKEKITSPPLSMKEKREALEETQTDATIAAMYVKEAVTRMNQKISDMLKQGDTR